MILMQIATAMRKDEIWIRQSLQRLKEVLDFSADIGGKTIPEILDDDFLFRGPCDSYGFLL